MDPAAPFLFRDTPTSLPVRKTVVAIVWISWPRRNDRLHHWWKNRLHRWHDDLGRRGGWWATAVMNPTAPGFFISRPGVLGIDSAIEWVHWSSRCCRRCWRRRRRRGWRRCWERRRRYRNKRHRQSRGRATPAHGHAAVIFLLLRPHRVIGADWATHSAIPWLGGAASRQQPEEKRKQQQETQKAAARDEASEIPPRPHDVEVTSETNILVVGFLDVLSLPSANIR